MLGRGHDEVVGSGAGEGNEREAVPVGPDAVVPNCEGNAFNGRLRLNEHGKLGSDPLGSTEGRDTHRRGTHQQRAEVTRCRGGLRPPGVLAEAAPRARRHPRVELISRSDLVPRNVGSLPTGRRANEPSSCTRWRVALHAHARERPVAGGRTGWSPRLDHLTGPRPPQRPRDWSGGRTLRRGRRGSAWGQHP